MTLLGFYRIIEFKGNLSLDTITDRGQDLQHFLPIWKDFIENKFLPDLKRLVKIPELKSPRVYPILKSGPISKIETDNKFEISFTNSSVKALVMSSRTFFKKGNEVLLSALTNIAQQLLGGKSFLNRLKAITLVTHKELDY
jgi:hypothetical protein